MKIDVGVAAVVTHPCDQPVKGGCQQKCTKDGEGAICGCNEGFNLGDDEKSCQGGAAEAAVSKSIFNHE